MRYLLLFVFLALLALSGCQNYQADGAADDAKSTQIELTEQQKLEAAKAPEGMVYVPAGPFLSGMPAEWKEKAQAPATEVMLDAFLIDRLEVTNAQFESFVQKNPEWAVGHPDNTLVNAGYLGAWKNGTPSEKIRSNPVVEVSWHAAKAYCESLGKRLPGFWEWEKAARGTDGRAFPWGNKMESGRANFCDQQCGAWYKDDKWNDGFQYIAPVGSFPNGASPYGVLDMGGNVREWVNDWFDEHFEYYKHVPPKNPSGPADGREKVVRGRSFQTSERFGLELYYFEGMRPVRTEQDTGFRCAADVK